MVCVKGFTYIIICVTYILTVALGDKEAKTQERLKSLAPRPTDSSSDPQIHVLPMRHDSDRAHADFLAGMFYFPGKSLLTG